MAEHFHKLKEWWASLAEREQRVVAIGCAVVGIFIAYQLMWVPVVARADMQRKQVITQKKLLAWMQATDKQLQQADRSSLSRTQPLNPVLLLAYLQKKIQQSGLKLALKQLKQTGSDSVELHFQKVEFDKLIVLLMQTVNEQAVTISQLSATADITPGMVNADIHLQAGR